MNVKKFMGIMLGILSSVSILCEQLQNYASERPDFIKEAATIIFTTAAPIVVQFGGYGYFIAFICGLIGFIIEACIIRKILHLPYKFIAVRLLIAHALALGVQLVVGLFIFGIFAAVVAFGFATASMQKHTAMLFSYVWLLLVITAAVVLFVVVTNMIVQYYVFLFYWRNKDVPRHVVKKAVIYANVMSYVLVLGILVTVNHFTTIFKDARVNCRNAKNIEHIE